VETITIPASGIEEEDDGFTPSGGAARWVDRGNEVFQGLLPRAKKRSFIGPFKARG